MTKKRVLYFDILNIAAALSVIFLHCNGLAHTYSDTLAWKQAFFIETVCYWAVPVFLMLSGANLMNYREKYSTKEFFKKRFFKTVIPFVVWSVIISVEKGINPFEIGFGSYFDMFINPRIENVYWFFPMIFGVYLAMPVLSLLKDNKKILWYIAGGAIILNSIVPSVLSYVGLSWNGELSMKLLSGYLLFPVLGYLFANTDFKKYQRVIIYILGIFGACLRYFGTWFLSEADGVINKTFYGGYAYYSVFLACAVFTFAKYFKPFEKLQNSPKACKIISTVSSCSFGIYLIHMTVLRFLGKVIPRTGWEWRLLIPFAIYIVALAVVFILKKIPVLKHIVP